MHFSDPHHNLMQLGLHEGMKIADLGTGTGHYAHLAAAAVGHSGKVYAVDLQEDVLKHMKHGGRASHHSIIEAVWGDIERLNGTKIRDHALDAVILSNTLFQVHHRDGLVAEIKRIIKPGGKLLVIDWAGAYGGMGPKPDRVVPEQQAEAFFIQHSFHKVKNFRAGPHHYGLVFTAS